MCWVGRGSSNGGYDAVGGEHFYVGRSSGLSRVATLVLCLGQAKLARPNLIRILEPLPSSMSYPIAVCLLGDVSPITLSKKELIQPKPGACARKVILKHAAA